MEAAVLEGHTEPIIGAPEVKSSVKRKAKTKAPVKAPVRKRAKKKTE